MSIDEIKANIGEMVMTTDPGHKMIPSGRQHGPYKLLQLTKSGRCILEGWDEYRVIPKNIQFYKPNATDQ